MIFVTVGNATHSFRRLLVAVDVCAESGLFGAERVFAQTGYNPIQLGHCEGRSFLSRSEFRKSLEEASLVISHGGAGTILEMIHLNKVPVVMPRRKRYGEHVNDHQVQLVRAMASQGWIVPVFEPEELAHAFRKARRSSGNRGVLPSSRMLPLIARAIEELAGGPPVAERCGDGSRFAPGEPAGGALSW